MKQKKSGIKESLYSFIPCKISNKVVVNVYDFLRVLEKIIRKNLKKNYNYNKKYYQLHATSVKNAGGFIEDQHSYTDMKYGKVTVRYSGCEVISVYNAIWSIEKKATIPFVKMVRDFEKDGMVLRGIFGTSPKSINKYLNKHGYKTVYSVNENEFDKIGEKSRSILVTYYNDGKDISKMIHTIAITKAPDGLIAHNVHCDGRVHGPYKSVSEVLEKTSGGRAKGIYIVGII